MLHEHFKCSTCIWKRQCELSLILKIYLLLTTFIWILILINKHGKKYRIDTLSITCNHYHIIFWAMKHYSKIFCCTISLTFIVPRTWTSKITTAAHLHLHHPFSQHCSKFFAEFIIQPAVQERVNTRWAHCNDFQYQVSQFVGRSKMGAYIGVEVWDYAKYLERQPRDCESCRYCDQNSCCLVAFSSFLSFDWTFFQNFINLEIQDRNNYVGYEKLEHEYKHCVCSACF